jgi:type IV pilus assembly protein PilM
VDLAAFAVQNAFERNFGFSGEETVALINIGAAIATINIVARGMTMFTREVTIGGNAFTEEIQKQLAISFEEAEAYKVGGGGASSTEMVPGDVDRILAQVSETVSGEFQRSLDFYLATSSTASIDRIHLTGGSAQVGSLVQAIRRRSRLDVEVFDPFVNVTIDETRFDVPYLRAHAPMAAVAMGLALRRPGDSF